MDNAMGFNQALLAGGINHGMVTYGKDIGNIGTGAIHLRYVAYGKMDRMDENGEQIGTFSAGDFALGGSIGRTLNKNISIGRSEEHTSELQSRPHLVCRLLLEKKK